MSFTKAMKRARKLRRLRNKLWADNNGCCHYCQKMTFLPAQVHDSQNKHNLATLDHIIVRARGGTDDLENLVLACYECNQYRGVMNYEDFVAIRNNSDEWQKICKIQCKEEQKRLMVEDLNKKRAAGLEKHQRDKMLAQQCGHNGIRLLAAWINRANFAPRKDGKGEVIVVDIRPWEHYRGDVPTEDSPSMALAA